MWRKEYRIVYYSWEFDTLQSFYRDLLRLPQMYGWYTSPVDRGCKFKIGDNRLELICRHPTLPQGPAGMRLEARDIELCYANLRKEPRVTVISPLALRPWGEYSFCIKDPVGNWVEVYQRAEQYHPAGPDDGGCYFTDEYTAILFAEDLEKITAFYRDSMQMPVVTQWDRGPEDRGCRLRSAGGFTDIRQKTENTPQGPALTTIEAEDVNACFAWLESRPDVEVLLGLTDTWYGDRIFQICDAEKNVVEVLEQGLQSGAIQIPGTLPGSPDGFENVENVTGYLNTFGVTVADRIRNQFMPLFDPAKEPLSDEVLAINDCIMSRVGYSLYDAQLAVAEAVKRQLARKSVALIIAECGSGKSVRRS